MTKELNLATLIVLVSIGAAIGQEAPSPTATAAVSSTVLPDSTISTTPMPPLTPEESAPAPPIPSVASSATPAETPFPSPARSVRISFVPPPLEGTINLGIYDSNNKLVRVLHRDAGLDDFTVGADALVTKWDGKDDTGRDSPTGKYHARGYLVGPIKVQDRGTDTVESSPGNALNEVQITLVSNPLAKDEPQTLTVAVGIDEGRAVLKAADGLPLYTIPSPPAAGQAWLAKSGEKTIDVWQNNGNGIHHLRISNLDKIMAFDCGSFELK